METLAFLLSIAGTILVCLPSLLKGKRMNAILILLCLANTFTAISYALTGAWNGAASCAIGAVQTIINYNFERKDKPLPKWMIGLYAAAFILVNVLVFSHFSDILAILACLVYIGCVGQKNGKTYRLWTSANAILWILYDVTSGSYGPIVTHSALLLLSLAGMFLHDRKEKS